jgi:transcriptional regulator with XRE-family HTH domain
MAKLREVVASQIALHMKNNPRVDTQSKLAKAAEITQSTVARTLTKQTGPSVDVLESIAKALGVSVIELVSPGSQPTKQKSMSVDEQMLLGCWRLLSREDRLKALSFINNLIVPTDRV